MVIMWAKVGGIMRDKMADKKVIVWARLADKKVIVWAKMWGIMKDKIAD